MSSTRRTRHLVIMKFEVPLNSKFSFELMLNSCAIFVRPSYHRKAGLVEASKDSSDGEAKDVWACGGGALRAVCI